MTRFDQQDDKGTDRNGTQVLLAIKKSKKYFLQQWQELTSHSSQSNKHTQNSV